MAEDRLDCKRCGGEYGHKPDCPIKFRKPYVVEDPEGVYFLHDPRAKRKRVS